MMKTSPLELIEKWIRPEIRALSAYPAPTPGEYIKLDAMENPYIWAPEQVNAWLESLRGVALNRYPDAAARDTQAALRRVMQVPADMDLLLGNGSDEIIQMLALALGGAGHTLLAPEPGFIMYKMLAQVTGLRYVGVPLRAGDFALDIAAMLEAIERHQPALVFLAYPNNPTANVFERGAIEAVLRAAPGVVVLDEAYSAFTEHSFMQDLGAYPNLLVMRTLSKVGLAGLRLGMLAGPAAWIEELEKIRLPYNINVLTQASAQFALAYYEILHAQTQRIRQDREVLAAALRALPGVRVWPSEANFILLRVPQAHEVFQALRQRGILIKCLHGSHPLLTDCLRVTVGAPEENRLFLEALQHLL